MSVPAQYRADYEAMPPCLRELLDAELAAGNSISEVGHSFPAPPAGAYFKLARPVTTRPRQSGDGLSFRDRNSSLSSGEFTDEKGFYFIVEPPRPPPPEPDMDAIRRGHNPAPPVIETFRPPPAAGEARGGRRLTLVQRFEQSMMIDYEKWHDGIGYDLDLIREASAADRRQIEAILLARGVRDWRDVEALAVLDSTAAHAALQEASRTGNAEIRLAVVRHAPKLVSKRQQTESLVQALETAEFYGGFSQALDQAADFHPPAVMDALFRGALERKGECAVHFAAVLTYIFGKATSRFDMTQRPFFLRFNTPNRAEREVVFRELCQKLGVAPEKWLR